MTLKRLKKYTAWIALLMSGLTVLASLASCSDTLYHEDHDHADAGIVSTPEDAIDYNLTFEGTTCLADRGGAVAKDGDNIIIIKSGVYRLTGEYTGRLQVSVADTEHVTLIMDELTIQSPDSAALYVQNAGCVFVEVPEGKTSTLSDAATYVYDVPGETKPNACIYAADDITFRGAGTLVVNANYNNGIGCNNDIVMKSGKVTVNAVNNAVKGEGSVTVTDTAKLDILRADDGIKSDGISEGEGVILINGQAEISVVCADDAIQALTSVTVSETARIYYRCEGNLVNCDGKSNVADGTFIPKGFD